MAIVGFPEVGADAEFADHEKDGGQGSPDDAVAESHFPVGKRFENDGEQQGDRDENDDDVEGIK